MRKLYQNVNYNAPRTPARGGHPRKRPNGHKVTPVKEPPSPPREEGLNRNGQAVEGKEA